MISYLSNPIGFYGSSNDSYVLSTVSLVETWRSNNNKERIGAYISMVKESVKAETGQENKQTIDNIYKMLSNAKSVKDIANVYQALRSYATVTNANKTKNAIANGDALDFYCKFENPNDKQYCVKFESSDTEQTSNNNYYYAIVGFGILAIFGYIYRDEIEKKLFY